ncbi:MAG: aminotransferase class I/II-fold pyridoxal phosphate-dependent enzyme, partial [Alphaproteobacteria bacterium]|nr:aminotransferase class I/II-fold pyridoxal phosphate-dependent enzyme [Alphaproteobacteria bacterium]
MRFVADQQVEDIEMPENLKLNTFLQEFHSDCPAPECRFGLYGFAFGQSPFHVPAPVREALCAAAGAGSYAAVPGIPELREAISRYNRHYFGFDAAPERVYTNGLSKSHAAGGYRLGYVVFPHHAQALRAQFKKILATEYTAVSTPIQRAAVAGFEPGRRMDEYFGTARAIHRIMAEYTHRELCSIAVSYTHL